MKRKTETTGIELTCTRCEKTYVRLVGARWARTSKCQECVWEDGRMYRRRNRIKLACRRHGITISEYEAMFALQNGRCGICQKEPNNPYTTSLERHRPDDFLNIDHDHATGKFRGLLCVRCNAGIGYFLDSVERLGSAILYLSK